MLTILKLFGRSPFAPLHTHMGKVAHCVHKLPELFEAVENGDATRVEVIAEEISQLEHEADMLKNDIRNHLPKSLFLPIDRSHLLEILTLQDNIADKAEDAAVLTTLKPLKMPAHFKEEFAAFLSKNIEAFNAAEKIIDEMKELLESSFGGTEAEKVREMVDNVAYKEHEADLIQRELLKKLFNSEKELSYTSFHLWQKLVQTVGEIANLSEKLGWRVRRTLEIK